MNALHRSSATRTLHLSAWTRRGCAAGLMLAAALTCAPVASAHDSLADRIALVTAQLARNPANSELLLRRADLHREAREWNEAFTDLDRATRAAPTSPVPDLARARVFLDAHNWTAAVDSATRFLAQQPGNADALIVRGRAHARAGQARTAVRDFTRALDQRPLPDVYIERARTLSGLGRAEWEEAVRGLDNGIARLGPIVTLELEAVDLDLRLRRFDSALARLDQVAAQASRKDNWLARRAAVLEQAGRLDEAQRAYAAALDSARSQPEHIRQTHASVALIDRLSADVTRLGNVGAPASRGRKGDR